MCPNGLACMRVMAKCLILRIDIFLPHETLRACRDMSLEDYAKEEDDGGEGDDFDDGGFDYGD